MKRKTYILLSLILTALVGASALWNFSAQTASAQKSDEVENLGVIVVGNEYNARDEFALTQGGANGVWNYGYSTSDADNTLNLFTVGPDTDTIALCSGLFERWRINNPETIPQIARYNQAATCANIPSNALFIHPGKSNQRAVLRFNAPTGGTFQITGTFQKQALNATSDLKIIKNAATAGETVLYTGVIGAVYQQTFNFTVTIAAGDKIDFSVGDDGNNDWTGDGSSIAVTIGQPVAACSVAPANLQVNIPAENSPSDVQGVNTNASLVGDAAYNNMGKVGRAFEFDGNGDYVRVEDNAAQRPATAVTVEGWFKFDSASGIVSLISKPIRGSALNSYTLYLDGGQLRGLVGNASQFTRALSSFSPQTGVWHHLAFTYDFSGGISTLRLYANGTDVTSGQDGTANLPLFYDANPFPLLIGGEYENNAPGFFLAGKADEVSVYGRALTQTEIFDSVQQGSFGKCPPAACVQSPNNLVSWFAGEQNALDSRSNNHGTLQGGATFASGKVGQAFNFDGVDDYVQTPLQMTPQTTIEAWVNPSILTGGHMDGTLPGITRRSIAGTADFGVDLAIGLYGGKLGAIYKPPTGISALLQSNIVVQTGTWYHVAVTIDGTTARLYVNGNLEASGATATNYTPHTDFRIGRVSCCAADMFGGLVDEVGVYNRALTATEISSIYNANSSGKCKPTGLNPAVNLVGFWTGDGDTRDFAGEDQNGTNNGATFAVGKVGQSFNFNGSSNVEVTNAAQLNPSQLTIETWVYKTVGGDADLVGKDGEISQRQYWLGAASNARFRPHLSTTNNGLVFFDGATAYNLNEWYHVAMTYDGANLRLYVNGVLDGSTAATGSIISTTQPLRIGGGAPSGQLQNYLNGRLDEVSLYDRALSPNEIAAIYNAGTAGKLKSATVNFIPPTVSKNAKRGSLTNNLLLQPATVQLSDATVSFANLTGSGTVSENGIDLGFLPKLPSSVIFTGLAYDISTTASYQNGSPDDVQVCFNVPALASFTFANLRILHLENGTWVNRTAAGNTSPVLCTDNLTSLSPFVIVESLAPTAASVSVSGRVADASGAGLAGVSVSLNDSQGRSVSTRTNNFGRYSFTGVAAGEIYVVGVASKRYTFGVASQAINVQDAVENVDFTADSGARRFDETKP